MSFKHHDEARTDAVVALINWLESSQESRIALIDDLYGKYHSILWPDQEASEKAVATIKEVMSEAAGNYWSDQVWVVARETSQLDKRVYDGAWLEGRPHPKEPRLRIIDRVRNRVAWFGELTVPLWEARPPAESGGPPIIVFYSFKGGVGRTTDLASAIQRARAGERVVIIDGDLEAPGIGSLFTSEISIQEKKGRVMSSCLELKEAMPSR